MAKSSRIDSRDRTLGLFSIDDVYKKLLWEIGEFDRLSHLETPTNLPACYMAQNAASTAWHMGEWMSDEFDALDYWGEASRLTGQSLSRKQSLQDWMRTDFGLMACEQIADATKHAKLFPWVYKSGFATETNFYNIYAEVDEAGVVTKVRDMVEVVEPIPKVVLAEGSNRGIYELKPILDAAASWWRDLLATIRYTQQNARP